MRWKALLWTLWAMQSRKHRAMHWLKRLACSGWVHTVGTVVALVSMIAVNMHQLMVPRAV